MLLGVGDGSRFGPQPGLPDPVAGAEVPGLPASLGGDGAKAHLCSAPCTHMHTGALTPSRMLADTRTRSPACVPMHLVLLGPVMLAGTSPLVQAQPGCNPRSLHTRQRHLPENDPRCSLSLTSPASPPAKGLWGWAGGAARGDNSPVCAAFKYSATPSHTLAFHGPTGRRQPGSWTHLMDEQLWPREGRR